VRVRIFLIFSKKKKGFHIGYEGGRVSVNCCYHESEKTERPVAPSRGLWQMGKGVGRKEGVSKRKL